MALLYRLVKLPDRFQTHVFTFVVTKSVTRDPDRDVTSKEFACGHQKWSITFSRTDKMLGAYLVWKSASESVRVYVDFTFTILNREHFSVNESFAGKQVKFTTDCPAQGNRNYIPVSDLYGRNFTDANGEFQLELSIGHVRTVYDTEFGVPTSLTSRLMHHHHQIQNHHNPAAGNALQHQYGTASPRGTKCKLETSYFTFGGFDWNLALYPHGVKDVSCTSVEGRMSVYLNRCTGFDHQCRVRYMLILGDGEKRLDSGILDDVSDSDGKSYGWHPRYKFSELVTKGTIRVHLEMLLANTLSEVISSIVITGINQHGVSSAASSGVVASPTKTQCYDRDKHAWSIRSDCQSETVRLHMVYKDIQNVPRNHLRYVCWTAYLLRYHGKTGHVEPVPLPGAPFSHYYATDATDEGIIMETDISVKELRDSGCPFLTDKGQLRVQVEWEESYLLFQATYHKYDDVSRTHNYQMRREITALQAENYSLERQLFSYQKSMSLVQSRGTTYSDDLDPTDLGDGGCVPVDDREDQPHHQHSQGVGAGGGAFYDDGAPLQLQSAVVVGPDGYPLAPHHQHHHQQQQHPPHHQLHHHHPLPQPPQQHHHHHP